MCACVCGWAVGIADARRSAIPTAEVQELRVGYFRAAIMEVADRDARQTPAPKRQGPTVAHRGALD